MLSTIVQFLCMFLFTVGVFFVIIGLRTKFDKSYLPFGLTLLSICLLTAIDVLILPRIDAPSQILLTMRVVHIITLVMMSLLIWYIVELTYTKKTFLFWTVHFIAPLWALSFFTRYMIYLECDNVEHGILYHFTFSPYAFIYVIGLYVILIKGIKRNTGNRKKLILYNFLGIFIFSACQLGDAVTPWDPQGLDFFNFTLWGNMLFGITVAIVFTEQFVMIIYSERKTFEKLQETYKDLEQANALKQLGNSAALVNHEIKNMMFGISAQLVRLIKKRTIASDVSDELSTVQHSIEKASDFSKNIIESVQPISFIGEHEICLAESIQSVIESRFYHNREDFHCVGCDKEIYIRGDNRKIETFLVNILQNALDASDKNNNKISIRLHTSYTGINALVVEDFGHGCSLEEFGHLFEAFYTTKSEQSGTGLGMSIARNIVEGHGGQLRAYPKNVIPEKGTGLIILAIFPTLQKKEEQQQPEKKDFTIINQNIKNPALIFSIFQNVKITPLIVESTTTNKLSKLDPVKNIVLLSDSLKDQIADLTSHGFTCHSLSNHSERFFTVKNDVPTPEILTEEFIIQTSII